MNIEYYQQNAEAFFESTAHIDFSATQNRFMNMLPANGKILDAGCGSGRDTLAFLQNGFDVDAFDASEKMAKLATEHTGISVRTMRFDEVTAENTYDGIFACASLLHVPMNQLVETMNRLIRALVVEGHLYVSFKAGIGEVERNGRIFTDLNVKDLRQINAQLPNVVATEYWVTEDARPERDEKWINVIFTRKA